MSLRPKPKHIFINGQLWDFKYKSVNKTAYENQETKELKLFARWQVIEGSKDADTKSKKLT